MKRKWLWAGIDVGVESASICVIDADGQVVHEKTCVCSTGDIRRELCHFRRTRYASVGLEAGGGMHVARALKIYGYPAELYEARQLSKFLRARRNKTDAGDARGIAEAGRIGASIVSKVFLKSLECQALQSRLAVRQHLVRQRVAAVNMLGRQFEVFGGRLRCRVDSRKFQPAVRAEIRRVIPDCDCHLAKELGFLADHVQHLLEHHRAVDRELEHLCGGIEECRRFTEIPGVGPLCALTFYATIGDPYRFSPTTDVGSYLGLAPRLHESGLTSRKARISKMGNKTARALLVRAAVMYMRYCDPDSALRHWTLQLQERRGRGKSRVALARKLAVIMLAMWKTGKHFASLPSTALLAPVADASEEGAKRKGGGTAEPVLMELNC